MRARQVIAEIFQVFMIGVWCAREVAASSVVESRPDGVSLTEGTQALVERLPDPRSPQAGVWPLACLVALYQLTASPGSAVRGWTVGRASQPGGVGGWGLLVRPFDRPVSVLG